MASTARTALMSGLLGLVGLIPAMARAQATTAPDPTAAPAQPAPTETAAPAATGSAAPVVPATGYGWSTTPKKPGHGPTRPHLRAHMSQSPDAILPGFETLGDGSTRLFVQFTRPVQYTVKPAQGTITCVLKGAHVDRRNNYNPLVTVHFNTPVTSARLVPHGADLWFVVDLRANVTPQVTMDAAKDGGAMLRIEFPRGDYLPGEPSATPAPPTPAPPADAKPAPPSSDGH